MRNTQQLIELIVAEVPQQGWSVLADSIPLIISAVEYRNREFVPNITAFPVNATEPNFTVPSTAVELSRSVDSDARIRGRQVIVDHSMATSVTSENVLAAAGDELLQISANAGEGDVELIAELLLKLLTAIIGEELDV